MIIDTSAWLAMLFDEPMVRHYCDGLQKLPSA
jgi:uncharacterized protein with PIN domain